MSHYFKKELLFTCTVSFAFLIFLLISDATCQNEMERKRPEFKIRIQPELNNVDLLNYLRQDRLFNFQLKCVLYDQYCDIVGRWLVPRMSRLLLGECLKCTKVQAAKLPGILDYIQQRKPEVYVALLEKYVYNNKDLTSEKTDDVEADTKKSPLLISSTSTLTSTATEETERSSNDSLQIGVTERNAKNDTKN